MIEHEPAVLPSVHHVRPLGKRTLHHALMMRGSLAVGMRARSHSPLLVLHLPTFEAESNDVILSLGRKLQWANHITLDLNFERARRTTDKGKDTRISELCSPQTLEAMEWEASGSISMAESSAASSQNEPFRATQMVSCFAKTLH